jgi:hypothetical protein
MNDRALKHQCQVGDTGDSKRRRRGSLHTRNRKGFVRFQPERILRCGPVLADKVGRLSSEGDLSGRRWLVSTAAVVHFLPFAIRCSPLTIRSSRSSFPDGFPLASAFDPRSRYPCDATILPDKHTATGFPMFLQGTCHSLPNTLINPFEQVSCCWFLHGFKPETKRHTRDWTTSISTVPWPRATSSGSGPELSYTTQ